jgi:hypothetical protein
VREVLDGIRNIAMIWPQASLEERKQVLDEWVDGVLICVDPIPGKRRANIKRALVFLKTALYPAGLA